MKLGRDGNKGEEEQGGMQNGFLLIRKKKRLFPTMIAAETHKLDDWSNKTHEMAFKSTTHPV